MYLHRRRIGGHHHGGSKHTDSMVAPTSMKAAIPKPSAINSGKHILPTKTADVSSLPTSRSEMMAAKVPPKMSASLSNMLTMSSKEGKSLPTGIAKSLPSMIPQGDSNKDSTPSSNSGAMAETVKAQKTPSKIEQLAHKPVIWTILIALFVIFVTAVIISYAIRKRKQRKLNEEKTRQMIHWHRNQGIA